MSSNTIFEIAASEMQDYIFAHTNDDEKKLLLKHKSLFGVPTSIVAQQIASRRKAETKLPTFFHTKGVVYPATINLEQSSSEVTANFKAKIIQRDSKAEKPRIADLTGGFGIDSFFFSDRASMVDYVESNNELTQIVQHNFHILKKENISFHEQTAEDFLDENSSLYDLIYVDPSRRDSRARKVFALSECVPNICQLLPKLLERTDFVLLKTSPLLDIKQALRELSGVKNVIVVSVANECRELLFLIKKKFAQEPLVQTFNLDYDGKIKHAFDFFISEEEMTTPKFSNPKKYLYEPNSSILKAGAFKQIGEKFRLNKIHTNTHLYTSDELMQDFPGRIFEVEELEIPAKSLAGKYANIISRNHPLSPDELKKRLRTKDGGEKYVIAFSGIQNKYLTTARRLA